MPGSWKIGDAVQCPVCSVSHLPLDRDIRNGVFAANCQNCGHYFKFRVESGLSSQITIRVNGKDYTVSSDEYSPTTTLNSFLRDSNISKGTKYMCTEGGCGTCMVQAKLYEPISDSKKAYSINSCLYPLFACDGWEITTIEGVPAEGDSAVPSRLAKYNGSQCGYCSPGQVMNIYSLLEFNKGQVSMQQVEDASDSVICRCTGYRPILDAMKSFATDSPQYKKHKQPCFVDIEEIGKICDKTGRKCTGSCHGNSKQMTKLILGDTQWFKPTTIQQVLDALEQNKTKKTKLVFGNTGFGIYKELAQANFESLIDLRGVQEMYTISFDDSGILGACLSLTQVQDIFYRMQNEPGFTYFKELYDRSRYLASHSVRNLGSWAGNLMLKHLHNDFPSDMYNMLSIANAQLMISDSKNLQATYNIKDFLSLDMTGKVIVAMILPSITTDVYMRTYKTAQRHQFAHAHVNAGIRMKLDKANNFTVKEKPVIVYGGISASFTHATQTEQFLTGKSLADPNVVKGALACLAAEVVPGGTDPTLTSPEYRKSLAIGFLYKFILDMLGDSVPAQFRSGAQNLHKPLSSGIQSYDTKPLEWPLTEPMTKIQGLAQTSGKAQYINDMPKKPGEVSVAFVVSTVGNARIQSIDASEVLKKPGVLKFLKASDIPGVNNCFPPMSFAPPGQPPPVEELFCSGKVEFCGQPLGIVITEGDHFSATEAASQVKVTYTDVQPPLLTIEEAIKQQSFFQNQGYPLIVGNAEGAISSAPRKITGNISIGGQFHLHMETQVAICTPTEDGMDVDASTQWVDNTQKAIAMVLGCYESSVNCKVKRLGGAYGGKISRNFPVSAATALAAHVMNRPARMAMDFHTNMETLGKRFNYMASYEVGCSAEGKLLGVKITYYADCGCLPYENALALINTWADNAYSCANWHLIPVAVKTNKPMNTAARSPGSCPAIFITEAIMEHVAKELGMDPIAFKTLNMYKQNQTTPIGQPLPYCNIKSLTSQLDQMASVTQRKQEIAVYNKANRWRKRAISVVPMKFGLDWYGVYYNVIMNVYGTDGSVSIAHGGVESGQGINTKVMQVCAYELGIPIDMIRVKPMNSLANANTVTTGGSVTSELNCQAVIKCCDDLKQRMAPVKAKMTNPTWLELVQKCSAQQMDLTSRYYEAPKTKTPKAYNTYGVTATEVELDVLSGQYQILRTDMMYDCGESLNPEIDMGQAEGAFVMGLGYYLTEDLIFNTTTGALANNSTWEYKPPMHNDIPIDFRVHFLKNAPNPLGVLRSKASGEPPLCMSCSAMFAVKHAVEAVRKDNGHDTYFALDGPATVEKIHKLCMLDSSQYVITG